MYNTLKLPPQEGALSPWRKWLPASGARASAALAAYSCFKVICEDYELPRIWEKPGRLY
jgi:hypothetical protein